MTKYVTEHAVGPHLAGEVIEFTDKHAEMGVDVKRLLRLGAIREANSTEAQLAVEYGNPQADELQPIPQVPYEPTDPRRITYSPDANRGQSPPTNASPVAPTTPIGGDLSHEPDEGDVARARERVANPAAAVAADEKKNK
jgi:hypothetical protein